MEDMDRRTMAHANALRPQDSANSSAESEGVGEADLTEPRSGPSTRNGPHSMQCAAPGINGTNYEIVNVFHGCGECLRLGIGALPIRASCHSWDNCILLATASYQLDGKNVLDFNQKRSRRDEESSRGCPSRLWVRPSRRCEFLAGRCWDCPSSWNSPTSGTPTRTTFEARATGD